MRTMWSLLREVGRASRRDRVTAEAARVAFFLFIAIFPALFLLFTLAGWIGREAAFHAIMTTLSEALPRSASASLAGFVREMTTAPPASALSLLMILSVWLASNIFGSLSEGLNAAYRVSNRRRWWKERMVALVLLALTSLVLLLGSLLTLAGPEIARLVRYSPLATFLRWPVTLALMVFVLWLTYFVLPNCDQRRSKRWLLAGALAATLLWVVATVAFRAYVLNFGRFSLVYGVLGGIVVLLLWLYVTAACVLLGGELAAVLERRAQTAPGRR